MSSPRRCRVLAFARHCLAFFDAHGCIQTIGTQTIPFSTLQVFGGPGMSMELCMVNLTEEESSKMIAGLKKRGIKPYAGLIYAAFHGKDRAMRCSRVHCWWRRQRRQRRRRRWWWWCVGTRGVRTTVRRSLGTRISNPLALASASLPGSSNTPHYAHAPSTPAHRQLTPFTFPAVALTPAQPTVTWRGPTHTRSPSRPRCRAATTTPTAKPAA